MGGSQQDIWSKWLTHDRFAGDQAIERLVIAQQRAVRDRILAHADVKDGDVVLDVGCGDGLIAFGALETLATSTVIFSDISQDLLDRSEALARENALLERCRFVRAAADDLSAIDDASVDVVAMRSVLIFVDDKERAFREFHRLLAPGGRLSIFEPIDRYFHQRHDLFFGVDVTPVMTLVEKIRAEFERIHPLETDPLLDFDERDLLRHAENAGFREIHLELKVSIRPPPDLPISWDTVVRVRSHPRGPTLEEAMNRTLRADERDTLVAYLRPMVESGPKLYRKAGAYLWATR